MINPTLEFLYGLHNRGIKLGLKNIESFLKLCGNPHKKIKTIHLAGTNGKGSTSSIIAKILQKNGYKVGLYTSPHLIHFNERIRINGLPISDEKIIKFIENHKQTLIDSSITFFEATTALAFEHFAEESVDIAIVETGLGGRLDSTNVLSPIQTIITEIHYDHTHILGDSIEEITSEKCGIFKDQTPSMTVNSDPRAIKTIKEHALIKNVAVSFIKKENIVVKNQTPISVNFKYENQQFTIPQAGSYQAQNAIMAIKTCQNNFNHLTHENIQLALDGWYWPARMQMMKDNFFYDVAHNRNGITILTKDLKEIYNKKPLGVVVLKNDKINPQLIDIFSTSFEKLIISTIPSKDILNKEEIMSNPLLKKFQFIENLNVALTELDKLEYSGAKVVFGSHYIAKDVYNFFDFSFDNGVI
ncbi:Mur ligase family protein [Candidatus Marinimicrobia bacterium]|jgi:dihydrofolate synthase/folylpolyglutamate synthase|nr:Mur ligase family protein [Candidatus Neomarinimicrobiota bacterium]MDA9841263.1 Mur ligase family protein [Candidatus Neomarinimicrobiota bacterium]MDC1000417.1 Mur ligase family protein [Candidatus Neomarinimicrobiota bacterium]MDC1145494.1 Mur ligase family protein [Candidatus Neomarinimicrobiota bacterium]|tara:strand:- start:7682 stop:8926 length:1245 start_codon:yes stop_codon:yes gene_type:complete